MGNQGEGVSGFERLLFGITRLITLVVAIVALSGIVICSMFLLGSFDKSTSVSYSEIIATDTSNQGADGKTQQGPVAFDQLPRNVRTYLSTESARTLLGPLRALETDGQWQASLNNLSSLAGEAESRGTPPLNVIVRYVELRMKKLALSDMDKYVATAQKYAAATAIGGLLFLLIQVSLVLVLLAIERHTRTALAPPTSRT